MTSHILVIDDEESLRFTLQTFLQDEGYLVSTASSFPAAEQLLKQSAFDLIFLDIHMPDFTGFDFIETLKNPPKIILTTSDSKFAIQAFEYDCIVDYLVKPITLERFEKAIQKAENSAVIEKTKVDDKVELSSGNDLYVNIDRRLIKIDIPSIYLVEAKGDYINVKTEDNNYTVHSTLKKIEDKLPQDLFLKVHRSYIINIKKIRDFEIFLSF